MKSQEDFFNNRLTFFSTVRNEIRNSNSYLSLQRKHKIKPTLFQRFLSLTYFTFNPDSQIIKTVEVHPLL